MVVFTCNNCGDSLQKPKVAKHYQFQCRKSISLTCVDCFKDFLGDEYVSHTKCITEAERYGSKDYVAKPSANKGEKKQQEWIKIVNDVINNASNLSRDEKNVLEHISKYENIPRKKGKFLNFIKNSMGFRVNVNDIESCWNKIEDASNKMASNKKNSTDTNIIDDNIDKSINNSDNNDNNELKEINENEQIEKKSSKKRKCDKLNSTDENDNDKKKLIINSDEIKSENNLIIDKEQIKDENKTNEFKIKFDWHSRILHVFGTKNEVPLKKLERKVVGKYLKTSDKLSNEKAVKQFHKKLNKMSDLVVNNDIVRRVK